MAGGGDGGAAGERAFAEATGAGAEEAGAWLRLGRGSVERAADLFFEHRGELPGGLWIGRGKDGEGGEGGRGGKGEGGVSSGGAAWPLSGRASRPNAGANMVVAAERAGEEVRRREVLHLGALGECRCWRSREVEDRGSLFAAHVAFPCRSEAEACRAIAKMKEPLKPLGFTHLMSAYRVPAGPGRKAATGADDDGEERGGAAIRAELGKLRALGVAVVVSRAYGGVHLGKARFEHIRERVRTTLTALKFRPDHVVSHDWGGGARRLGGRGGLFRVQAAPRRGASALELPAGGVTVGLGDCEVRRELLASALERRLEAPEASGGVTRASAREDPPPAAVVDLSSISD